MERSPTKSESSDSLVITVGYLLQEFVDLFLLQGEFLALEVGLHQTRIVGLKQMCLPRTLYASASFSHKLTGNLMTLLPLL